MSTSSPRRLLLERKPGHPHLDMVPSPTMLHAPNGDPPIVSKPAGPLWSLRAPRDPRRRRHGGGAAGPRAWRPRRRSPRGAETGEGPIQRSPPPRPLPRGWNDGATSPRQCRPHLSARRTRRDLLSGHGAHRRCVTPRVDHRRWAAAAHSAWRRPWRDGPSVPGRPRRAHTHRRRRTGRWTRPSGHHAPQHHGGSPRPGGALGLWDRRRRRQQWCCHQRQQHGWQATLALP